MTTINGSLANLVDILEGLAQGMAACCDKESPGIDPPPSDGGVEIGPNETFPDPESFYSSKCQAANWVFDGVQATITWLNAYNVDLLAGGAAGLGTAITIGLLVAGPPGWVGALAEIVIVGVATILSTYALAFPDVLSALSEAKEDAVLGMFNAANTTTAKTAFLTAIDDAATPITTIERALLALLMTNKALNNLFAPTEEVQTYTPPSPITCPSAPTTTWTFPEDEQSWTFRDDSTGGAVATRSYSAENEALLMGFTIPAISYIDGWGVNVSPALAVAVAAGGRIQADFGATSDGIVSGVHIVAIYDDETSEEALSVQKTAGTLQLVFSAAKTLESIEVSVARSTGLGGGPWTFNQLIHEVRLFSGA